MDGRSVHPMPKSLRLCCAALSLLLAVPAPGQAPRTINLADALRLARANSPQFQAAAAALGVAREDRNLARDALLPTVTYNNSYLYTQGGTDTPTPRYIANNAVHEYTSQGQIHQELYSGSALAGLSRARAGEALAQAQLEIAARGLTATVTADYYALLAADRKAAAATQAVGEAEKFVALSQKLQQGGEVAQADVLKAQLQLQSQQRAQQQAALAQEQARLNLAVLLSPKFDENFKLQDDLAAAPPLPSFARASGLAASANPDLRAAQAALRQAQADVGVARAGYLPALSLDYWYGIDADHFATEDGIIPGRLGNIPNLGYSAQATLAIPVWNWGATGSKVHQAQLRRHLAQAQLTYAQRKLLAELRAFYAEASTASAALDSLDLSSRMAAESLRLTNLRYQAGLATALEVVDAQNALIQARDALADGQARYHAALANLQTVTGTW